MNREEDIVRELAEADPVVRTSDSLICGLCAVAQPASAGHIEIDEHTAFCPYRRAVKLVFPKDGERIHLIARSGPRESR